MNYQKKILVTGADGFIGSHLVENLVKNNYSVKAFVLYNSLNSWGWLDKINKDREIEDKENAKKRLIERTKKDFDLGDFEDE